jgi:peptidoglycan glycosyltransferase
MATNGYRKDGRSDFSSLSARRSAIKQRGFKIPPHVLRNAGAPHTTKKGTASIIFAALVILLALIPTAGLAGGGVYYAQTAAQLKPRLATLHDYKPFQTSRIFDRNGTLLYEFVSSGRRDPVKLDQVADLLKEATIAIEDKNFWTNPGVDVEGIAKAAVRSLREGEETGGASTITQQVIKNIVLNEEEKAYENRYQRKIKEAVLAQQLTDEYSKEQILELYLNEINYGNLAYGIQAASQTYFGKNASELNLNEASLLAGIPQLPTLYNPILHLEDGESLPGVALKSNWRAPGYKLPFNTSAPRARQVDVLRQMVDNGVVTEREARQAIAQPLNFVQPKETFSQEAPHFAFYVKQLLENDPEYAEIAKILAEEGGLTITTTP